GAWSGTVFVLLVGRRWESWPRPALVAAMRKLSGLGLVAVATLAVTGVVSSLVHAGDPARFVGSEYATALVVKLAVVIVIVGLAAFNRFRFLPALVASGQL